MLKNLFFLYCMISSFMCLMRELWEERGLNLYLLVSNVYNIIYWYQCYNKHIPVSNVYNIIYWHQCYNKHIDRLVVKDVWFFRNFYVYHLSIRDFLPLYVHISTFLHLLLLLHDYGCLALVNIKEKRYWGGSMLGLLTVY